jgi:hypothetical protein
MTLTISPSLALVLAGEHDDLVALLEFRSHHSTSGASEMIFMKFFARSSRTTGPEDTGADRLVVVVEDHGGVAVEADRGAVFAAHFLGGAHDDGLADVAFLHAAARDGFLHRHHDDVAHGGVFPLGRRPAP